MTKKHAVMSYLALDPGTGFREPPYVSPAERFNRPALDFMTDFSDTTPITVGPEVPIDEALEKMRRQVVHLLIVIDDEYKIIGKVTAMELEGEEPVKLAQERRVPRSEIRVKEIMTPQPEIHALNYEQVAKAEVGHVVATLNYLKLKHLLVVETDPASKRQIVRGVFSRARIGAELRVNLNLVEVESTTLAERFQDK